MNKTLPQRGESQEITRQTLSHEGQVLYGATQLARYPKQKTKHEKQRQ